MQRMKLHDVPYLNSIKGTLPIMAACILTAPSTALAQQGNTLDRDRPDDEEIVDAIDSDLFFRSRVDASKIDVSAEDGIITLTGTVPTLVAKRRALETARSTRGVRSVVDRINVMKSDRADSKITSDVRAALEDNPATESYEVEVKVNDGGVTLKGTVDSMTERWLAADVASTIEGVRAIENKLDVRDTSARLDNEIQREIEERLDRDVRVDNAFISVDVENGNVDLTGAVGSASERLNATRLAYVKGVNSVDPNNLYVTFTYNDDMLKSTQRAPNFNDSELESVVMATVQSDPRVNKYNVDVTASEGTVTLSGEVPTLGAMRAAVDDARNTSGVMHVRNHINVRPSGHVTDDDLIAKVHTALKRDSVVSDNDLDVTVNDGVVTLKGDVTSDYERLHARTAVEDVVGVTHVVNKVDYERTWEWESDRVLVQEIEDQLFWSPFVDSTGIDVVVENGVATLEGEVEDYSALQAARENAWEGGARDVILDLRYETEM